MYKKLFVFFYIAIISLMLPFFAFAYIGNDGMDKHTTGVQIGNFTDNQITTDDTKFLLLTSDASQCLKTGSQKINFNVPASFLTNFQSTGFDLKYACVNHDDFVNFGISDQSAEDNNILTKAVYTIGNFKTSNMSWNVPTSLVGKVCKLWLVPAPYHVGRYIYTRPFQICGKSGEAPAAGNVQVNFVSWELDESDRGTFFNYLVSGLGNRQSVDFVFDIYSKDTNLMTQSVGLIAARSNGASRVLASGLWLTTDSNALIIPRIISINTASADIEESAPPTPPKSVNFSNLSCKTQTDGSISISGKLSSINNPPLSSWVVRYDGALKGQGANQILQNRNTKTAGLKSSIKVPTTIAAKVSGLNGQYCFGLNAKDKNGKYYPYFPSTPVCCAGKSTTKPADPIKIYEKFISGYKTQYAVIDPRGFKINLQLVKNRIFADIVGSDIRASNQASLIDAANAKVAMSGPYYYQSGGWRQWSINSTFVQNGKILRLLNIGSHICQKANGDILYGRFRALIKATTTNGKNSQSFVISNVNSMPPNGNSIIAFTKEAFPNGDGWRSSIPDDYDFKAAIVNNGKISFVSNGPFSPSGDYDYILVFYGTERNRFEKSAYPSNFLAQGQNISFSYQSIPGADVNMAQWQDCQTIIGLNHTVMYRGKTIINPDSNNSAKIQAQGNFDNSLVEDRDTLSNEASLRSMVGIGADNKIYFITVVEGLKLFDEYKIAKALNLQFAANTDGGCSAFLFGSGKFYSSACRNTVPAILYAK